MVFNFLVQAVIYVGILLISELLRPKPDLEDAEAAKFEDFGLPTTDPQRIIPVGWGTFRVSGPGVVWYGDYQPEAITREVKTGLFSSEDQIIGYKYYIGAQLGIARDIGGVLAIDWDDERLVTFSPRIVPGDSGTLVSVNEPDFLGGDEGAGINGGGIVGDFRFYRGTDTQTTNGYLSNFQNPISAYRHLAYCVMEGVYIGTQPTIKPIAFICDRFPNNVGIGSGRQVVQMGNGVAGSNPVEVIYECLTDDDWGLALPSSAIDLVNFRAIGVDLYNETHGYCNAIVKKSSVADIINDVLRQIDGNLFVDYETGLFKITLARGTGVSPVKAILNESNVVEVEDFTRASWYETTNRVVVNWNDPFLPQNPSPALQDDMANQLIQNRNVSTTFQYRGCADPTLAAQIAARELRGLSFPLGRCTLTANRGAVELKPGDVFELQWADLGIDSMVMRVTSAAIGSSDEIRIRISALQDVYSLADVTYSAPANTNWNNPATVAPAATLADYCFEAPLFLDRLSPLTSPVVASTVQDSRVVLVPVPNQQNVTGFRMMQNSGTGSPNDPDEVIADFSNMSPSGLLTHSIAIDQYLNPSSPETITVDNGSLLTLLTDTTETDIEGSLANLFAIDNELFSFETHTQNSDGSTTLSGIHRAKLDSVPATHANNTRVFFIGLGISFTGGITTSRVTSAGSVSARPITSRGILDAANANACTTTANNRIFMPVRPARVRAQYAGSPEIAASFFPTSFPRGDWIFTWDDRTRLSLDDIDVDETTAQGLETSTEVVIQFRSSTLSPELRREVTFASGVETYTYTTANQDADFGGPGSPVVSPANQDIIVRVFTRRTGAPLSGLTSYGTWEWTITRTGVA